MRADGDDRRAADADDAGDTPPFHEVEIEQCGQRTFAVLAHCGLRVDRHKAAKGATIPASFERLFPALGAALCGVASRGKATSFRQADVTMRLTGRFLAGGSTHPGPGVPMAALSGRRTAQNVVAGLDSRRLSPPGAIRGGTSTR